MSDEKTGRKTLTLSITDIAPGTTSGGHYKTQLTGFEVDGRRADATKKVALWGDLGRKFEAALASQGIDLTAVSPENPVEATLEGRWKKNEWQRDGQTRFAWEFKTDGFRVGDVVVRSESRASSSATRSSGQASPDRGSQADPQAQAVGDKPLKTLAMRVSLMETRFSPSGDRILDLRGTDDKGREARAIAWAQTGEDLEKAISDVAGDPYASELSEPVSVKLQGYWKARSWRNRDNATVKTFEFTVKSFEAPQPDRGDRAPAGDAGRAAAEPEL